MFYDSGGGGLPHRPHERTAGIRRRVGEVWGAVIAIRAPAAPARPSPLRVGERHAVEHRKFERQGARATPTCVVASCHESRTTDAGLVARTTPVDTPPLCTGWGYEQDALGVPELALLAGRVAYLRTHVTKTASAAPAAPRPNT